MGNPAIKEIKTPLLPVKNQKTVDIGAGHISASLHPSGLIHSINRAHAQHGFITLSPIGQFSNDKWYQSEFVRGYRKQLAETTEGFGLVPRGDWRQKKVIYAGGKHPRFLFESDRAEVESTFYSVNDGKSGFLVQVTKVMNRSSIEASIPIEIGGVLSLSRCSYGQLTEGGPIPVPPLENELNVSHNQLSVKNRHLSAQANLTFFDGSKPLKLDECVKKGTEPIKYQSLYEMTVNPGETKVLTSVFSLVPAMEEQEITFDFAEKLLNKAIDPGKNPALLEDIGLPHSSFIISRNIDYIMSCCAIPISDEHVCVITDHQLLPLSWNRDAYYMMALLLESASRSDFTVKKEKIRHLVKGHLLWLFEKAERPDHYWGRAYLTNGFCKDKVFQIDQQCYPLLELCRYAQTFDDEETVEHLSPFIEEILQIVLTHKDEEQWLFQTRETPADDKVDYPYHFSSQILVWHTLNELAALNKRFSFTSLELKDWADHLKKDCLDAFRVERMGKPEFAYLADLKGNYQFYHDANDIPTVLAPVWGFCEPTDPAWVNTMEFAFTEENKGGYYAGLFGGLGSVHTPHPWPLGDGQELLYSELSDQPERVEKVWEKLIEIVQWDGLFSEAVSETSGAVESRHWFSWPGAFISTVLLYLRKS